MEHSFKRRRVSGRAGGPVGIHHRFAPESPFLSEGDDPELSSTRSFRASHSPRSYNENILRSSKDHPREESRLSHLHSRNLIPGHVNERIQSPAQTVVASVIQVVVNNGAGSEVTQLLVPVSSKLVSVQGFAPITLGKGPSPSARASPKNTNNAQPTATNPARHNSQPAVKTAIAASRTENPSKSQPTQSGGYGGLSNSGPGSKSQVVLSSPPSTPLPSTPVSAAPSSSTGSYFSSAAPGSSSLGNAALSTSGGDSTATNGAQSSSATQTLKSANHPVLSTRNSTSVMTSSQSGAQTTSASPILVNPTFSGFNSSSTFVTSTRSRSSFATGASLTSSASLSQSASSFAASSSGSASASSTAFSSSGASSTPFSSSGPSSSASSSAPSTGGAAGGIGGPGSTASSPTSSATSGAGSAGSPVSTPVVVGSVVGGLAGFAAILVLILFFLRWRRSKMQRHEISPSAAQSLPPGIASTAPTTQRSSIVPFAAGGFMRRMRPGSGQTAETTETGTSERGFQNLGGRRLQSVLSSRGDGYSDPAPPSGVAPRGYSGTAAGLGLAAGVASPAPRGQGLSPGQSDNHSLSGSSFYRDSHGFYGGNEAGPSSPPPTSPTSAAGSPPGEGIAVTRPGPARTPVINQPGFAALRPPPGTGRGTPPPIGRGTPPPPGTGRGTPPPRNLTPQLRQQDDIGRSHPSFDGSRGSRFSESFGP